VNTTTFFPQPSEIKGITRELGEMKIPLIPYARPIKQRPYRLNPIYKNKVKDEIDMMPEASVGTNIEILAFDSLGGKNL
jgi:hypothetical protein